MGLNTAWIVRDRGAIPIVEVILAAQGEVVARAIRAVFPPHPAILEEIVPDQVVAVAAAVGIKGSKGYAHEGQYQEMKIKSVKDVEPG